MMRHLNGLFLALLAIGIFLQACSNDPKPDEKGQTPNEQQPVKDPLFVYMDPGTTGIDFSNVIKEDFDDNIIKNSYLYNGGGVAIADFDQDGLQDVYFTATQQDNKLYHNKGNFKFEDITDRAGVAAKGGNKTGVTIVDINQDGYPDIYVCRTGLQVNDARRNLLYVNNKDLTFTESGAAYNLNDISPSNQANFFDYDNDGDLDMYLLNHPVDFQNVNRIFVKEEGAKKIPNMNPKTEYDTDRLYRNDGNGKFTDVSKDAGIYNRAWGLSVTVSDFNGDGNLDVFVGNDYIEPDFLYINNGNGTFTENAQKYFPHMSNHTMGVDIADYNNDEKVDVVALDMIAEDNYRQKTLMTTMVYDRYNTLNSFGYGKQLMRNVLQINQGDGSFQDIGTLAGVSNTDWSWCPLLADFDHDSWKDLYITNGYRRDVSDLDYLHFTVDSINKIGGLKPGVIEFDDFLKIVPSQKLQNYMFCNKANMSFDNVTRDWGFNKPSWSNGAAYGDLDNDGDLDIVVNNIDDPAFVYQNTAVQKQKGNYLQVKLKGASPNVDATGAKGRVTLDDGSTQYLELTPTRGFLSSSEPIFQFGLGAKNVTSLEVEFPGKKYIKIDNPTVNERLVVDIKDAAAGSLPKLNKGGMYFTDNSASTLDFRHVEDDYDDFKSNVLLPHRLSDLGPALATGDVNGDGRDDVFLGGAANSIGGVYTQSANGNFSKTKQPALEADAKYEDVAATLFDADGDGDQDLYVVSGGNSYPDKDPNYQDRLYINDGKGNFSASDLLPAINSSGGCVVAHDYDKDGDLDLFVGGRNRPGYYPMAPTSYVLTNDKGKFYDETKNVAPELANIGMVTGIAFADIFPGDEVDEMVVVGYWMDVTVFNYENGTYQKVDGTSMGLGKTSGWWNSLTVADIDGDGDQDIIAGNLGLNTRLQATSEHPIIMYAKDFDGNGQIDPVMSWWQDGKRYPLPTKDLLIKQMAGKKRKFIRYETYAKATIDEVFSEKELQDAMELPAYTFANTWFKNDGNGKFEAIPLPRAAQKAPANAILLDDVDGNGSQDIILVGNQYGLEIETGPIDGNKGVLILNDKGTFTVVSNADSGLDASGYVKNAAIIRSGKGEKIILARNDETAKVISIK
ncbi:MAG: VCBS repeat-containing protein [Saprospiraceae bacterium]|nr:VCBS repeat-containing protein [Saprospiraceae bacterium]